MDMLDELELKRRSVRRYIAFTDYLRAVKKSTKRYINVRGVIAGSTTTGLKVAEQRNESFPQLR